MRQQCFQPGSGGDGVIIEKCHHVAVGCGRAAVTGTRHASVTRIGDDGDTVKFTPRLVEQVWIVVYYNDRFEDRNGLRPD